MGQMANIVAYDGAATPVLHTFYPIGVEKTKDEVVATWREELPNVPMYAQGKVTMKLKRLSTGVYRVAQRVEIHVMESVGAQNASGYTAPPKVAHVTSVETVGYYHERATIEQRRLVRQLAINIDGSVTTSVAPVTTGPVPELFDLLRTPT